MENADFVTKYLTPDLKLADYNGKIFKTEVMFEHHMLVWLISGETKMVQANSTYLFGAGDIFLIPRNQLATVINYPKNGRSHKSAAMHLTLDRLKNFYSKYRPAHQSSPLQKIHIFSKHPLLESCMASIIPYFDLIDQLPEDIASLKIEEAIRILRSIDTEMDSLLSDFEEPGKINLADFMEQHYMFNMPLEKFGYLTGRSLSTFQRDFKKIYQTTPQKWLTAKRLELAHYQLSEKSRKPVDVYYEAGFENLSHFSYAFKKQFGYAPTAINTPKRSAL